MATQHNNNYRTGANLEEKCLTPTSVKAGFRLLFGLPVEGQIYAQPLYISGVKMPDGSVRNIVYVATMKNRIYAFDADADSAPPIWWKSLGPPADFDLFPMEFFIAGQYNIFPFIGITSTPVVDTATHSLFALAKIRTAPRPKPRIRGIPLHSETVEQHLEALDLATGSILADEKIEASELGEAADRDSDGTIQFNALRHLQRPGLLLANGHIYAAFASHQDSPPWHGWIVAFDSHTLKKTASACLSCAGKKSEAVGIWQAGGGPAADDAGHVYVITGNGTWDSTTKEFGNSFVKFDSSLRVMDWFTPSHHECLSIVDADLGSAGPLLIPKSDFLVGGGKEGVVYLLDRNNLGHLQRLGRDRAGDPCNGNPINGKNPPLYSFQATPPYRESPNPGVRLEELIRAPRKNWNYHHIHGSPVLWSSATLGPVIYVWAERDVLRGFPLDIEAKLFPGTSSPNSEPTSILFGNIHSGHGMPGAALSLSANGDIDSTGVIWAALPVDENALIHIVPGVLRAFEAAPQHGATCSEANHCELKEIWNSLDGDKRHAFKFAKFAAPTIANGRVYLATFSNRLNVYGLKK